MDGHPLMTLYLFMGGSADYKLQSAEGGDAGQAF